MTKRWWERAIINLADVGTMYGMPPAWVELAILEQHERLALAAEREVTRNDDDENADDDEGDGGTKVPREPVAA